MLAVKSTSYLKKLIKKHPALKKQFVLSSQEKALETITYDDPLVEEKYMMVPGLVHKYSNRVLILLTMNCAAYCRFCTRRRSVSDIKKGIITEKDLNKMVVYIKRHPEIKELIFSGGDPLTVPELLKKALSKLSRLPQIKIIRVGSRLPVSDPKMINKKVLGALKIVKRQPLYLLLHFEHPAEITKQTILAVKKIQKVSTMVLSQSVFLKGVNDSVEILYDLFSRLLEIGIKPYYLGRCDPAKGAEHFIVDFKKEVKIFTELRIKLSGLACPMYVIDVPGGNGKIPVPLNFWDFNSTHYTDFTGESFSNINPINKNKT